MRVQFKLTVFATGAEERKTKKVTRAVLLALALLAAVSENALRLFGDLSRGRVC
jgi:hypothetical protein